VKLCKLTIVFPASIEDTVTEALFAFEPPLGGFTVTNAEGHGQDFTRASVREKVRGRVARRMLFIVLPAVRIDELIRRLRDTVRHPEAAYWIEPVDGFGTLQ